MRLAIVGSREKYWRSRDERVAVQGLIEEHIEWARVDGVVEEILATTSDGVPERAALAAGFYKIPVRTLEPNNLAHHCSSLLLIHSVHDRSRSNRATANSVERTGKGVTRHKF